ncbi:MAG TPA: response regulator transcription factor [Caldilineaceae bacterium]|nr:response regulator transcription factor [Caldilineaceae bacterium]
MRALLADDQAWLRSALRLLLEQEPDIEVVGEAANVQALLPLLRHLRPDLLFLDWQLPGADKASVRQRLLNTLRAIHPSVYIVALTNDDSAFCRLKAPGADAYISRAEPPEHVLAVVRQTAAARARGH